MKNPAEKSTFVFESYDLNPIKKEAVFNYRLFANGKDYPFTETILFPENRPWEGVPPEALRKTLEALHLIIGISYWKAYCSKNIVIKNFSLTKDQAKFWNVLYTKGLGEFFYKNQIDFRNLINFPFTSSKSTRAASYESRAASSKSLLLFGGGKDSLVSAELLKKADKKFDFFYMASGKESDVIMSLIPKTAIIVKRQIDPRIMELNQKGAYNGHIPITALVSFTAELAALLYGYRYVISSNEKSADYGNVEYRGEVVNHQWSKSLEFEKMFRDYTHAYMTPDVTYFSLLRPFYEIKIIRLFSELGEGYFRKFTSCNRNFKVFKERLKNGSKWCGECPKCVFVFTMLSAFVPKRQLVKIFGKNLFAKKELLPLFRELLGLKDFKPFECVGTKEEMIWAMYAAVQSGEYGSEAAFALLSELNINASEISREEKELFRTHKEHLIPKDFLNVIL